MRSTSLLDRVRTHFIAVRSKESEVCQSNKHTIMLVFSPGYAVGLGMVPVSRSIWPNVVTSSVPP